MQKLHKHERVCYWAIKSIPPQLIILVIMKKAPHYDASGIIIVMEEASVQQVPNPYTVSHCYGVQQLFLAKEETARRSWTRPFAGEDGTLL